MGASSRLVQRQSWGYHCLRCRGLIAVPLLDLLPEGLELSRAGVAVRGKGNRSMAQEEDVNDDRWADLVVQVETENLDPTKCQDWLCDCERRNI